MSVSHFWEPKRGQGDDYAWPEEFSGQRKEYLISARIRLPDGRQFHVDRPDSGWENQWLDVYSASGEQMVFPHGLNDQSTVGMIGGGERVSEAQAIWGEFVAAFDKKLGPVSVPSASSRDNV